MNKKKIFLIVSIITVALLVSGGALLWAVWQSTPKSNDVGQNSNSSVRQYSDRQQLIDDVNKKYGAGDYQGAIKLIESQNNSSDGEVQLLLAGAYANSGDYNKALEIYKKLDQTDKLPDTSLENMASIAESAKDYRLAIDLYKRAKTYELSLNTGNTDQIAVYDYKIADLEKKL